MRKRMERRRASSTSELVVCLVKFFSTLIMVYVSVAGLFWTINDGCTNSCSVVGVTYDHHV